MHDHAATLSERRDANPENWLGDHGDMLYRYAFARVHDLHVAEDLVQETLISAIQARKQFRRGSSLRTWLVSILRFKIADYFKDHRRLRFAPSGQGQTGALSSLRAPQISNEDFRSLTEKQEFKQSVQRCVGELPVALAEVFLERLRTDQPVKDVADQLHISATNFSVRMYRARLLLRKCLERLWLGMRR